MATKQNLNNAFKQLRKMGFVARQNFMCCGGCAVAALPGDTEKWVAYHKQAGVRLRDEGYTHVMFGESVEYGHMIVDVLRQHGLSVEWDGTIQQCIRISFKKEWHYDGARREDEDAPWIVTLRCEDETVTRSLAPDTDGYAIKRWANATCKQLNAEVK